MGPLDHEELRTIDALIDAGELSEAQQRLADLGQSAALDAGTSYLATRLLYLRGRLDRAAVAERLRDLIATSGDFPEARRMLAEAELDRLPASRRAPDSSAPPAGDPEPARSAPALELRVSSTPVDDPTASAPAVFLADAPLESAEERERFAHASAIPRAPGLPHFSEPPDRTPSYAPELDATPGLVEREPQHISDPLSPDGSDRAGRQSGRRPGPGQIVVAGQGERPLPRSEPADSGPPAPGRRVRSGAPPTAAPGALPSLFELATLLDEGQYRRVIDAVDPTGDAGPGYVLMRARALAGEGRRAEAAVALGRLTHAPLLDPELRAGAARVLLELGDLPGALAQASRAHEDDPEPPLVRITLAWALLRSACRRSNARALEQASGLLSGLRARSDPRPALVAALRGLSYALGGDPQRAIGAAQRALALDATSVDALAAIALASARLQREHDARQAWLRLLQLSYEEADAIGDELEALGVALAHLDPSLRPGAASDAVFEPIELMPARDRRKQAIALFEQLARARLTELAESGTKHHFPVIAPVAASFLATTAIARDFAPYDLSLWSIARVEAFAATLYGHAPRSRESDDFPVILLLGSYLGETLRSAHHARWEGSVARIDEALVVGSDQCWAPFEMVRGRIEGGATLDTGLTPGTEAWSRRIDAPATPPCPWDPLPWPAADQLGQLGRALERSPIGAWCEQHAGGPLDLSMQSLAALDRYVDLVAPVQAPPGPEAAWSRRPAVLLGAYVGEVLRARIGGSWQSTAEHGAAAFALWLGRQQATPIAEVLARLEGRSRTTLSAYARRIAEG